MEIKKQEQTVKKPGLTLEQVALMVMEDPMDTGEVCEALGKSFGVIWKIPYENLPYVVKKHSGKAHRLYSRRLVAKYLADNTRRVAQRDGIAIPDRIKISA